MATPSEAPEVDVTDADSTNLFDVLLVLLQQWRMLAIGSLAAGVLALGATFLLPKTFTSTTVFLPPLQQQSSAAAAIAQLGALSGLVGAAAGVSSPAEQYVALMQSATVSDRIIDAFGLMDLYEAEYRFQARRTLAANVRISLGRKDGLITVEVEDVDPTRAADIANRYVSELRRLTSELTLTEAQQRRAFFEEQLKTTRDRLIRAQQALEATGFDQGALRADAKTAAEGYARLRAEATAAEVRLQTLRGRLADSSAEVREAVNTLDALRTQMSKLERSTAPESGSDYIGRYREFKYQETLFELFARQFELARLDESKEGALVQVIDVAKPAEWKTRPKRAQIAVVTGLLAFLMLAGGVLMRNAWRHMKAQPGRPSRLEAIREAIGPRR